MLNSDPYMMDKRCLITGATSGIGKVTATDLAGRGASVVLVGRNQGKSQLTVEHIRQETGNRQIEYLIADLSVQAEIHQLAETFKEQYDRLDVLINNAGAIFFSREETQDGLERTFALNHLGYFLLTNLLLDMIRQSAPVRVINVSSEAHRGASINFDDLQCEEKFSPMRAYGQSKLANILFTYELDRRLENTNITVNALHPGFIASNFGRNAGLLGKIIMPVLYLFAKSPEKGAQTSIYLATSPEVEGVSGHYFINEQPATSSEESYDSDVAARLWNMSEELTG
ncbi:MAG TPA: SDR family oxidoreductase [bacterium]|nr:SDR family oxidoreductase [bacterium]